MLLQLSGLAGIKPNTTLFPFLENALSLPRARCEELYHVMEVHTQTSLPYHYTHLQNMCPLQRMS